jgi:hypothetical protein
MGFDNDQVHEVFLAALRDAAPLTSEDPGRLQVKAAAAFTRRRVGESADQRWAQSDMGVEALNPKVRSEADQ